MPAAMSALSPEVLAKYQPVIGLEVHVQLLTKSKAFCGCRNEYGGEPNTHTCPTCLGLPGALPVLNRQAVEFAVLASKALGCTINERSIFARKNYFYPDSPKGYQISQYDKPLAEHGQIIVPAFDADGKPTSKRIGITRLHMEEDAGKSLHDGFADSNSRTYIDLNRCGTPLVEIVSEPDLRTADEVFEYLTKLKEILLYTGVSDCNMEEGSLRCDANVSVMLKGAKEFGTKAEVKNVNSFRYIRAAVEYEIERQIGVIEEGGRVVQESRLWNNAEGRTYSMRSKEQAHDYRYFPEPDLPALVVGAKWQKQIFAGLPELPEAKRERLVAEYNISTQDAATLASDRAFADRFEAAAKRAKSPRRVAAILLSEITMRLRAAEIDDFEKSPVTLDGIVLAADLTEAGELSSKQLKQLLDTCFAEGQDFAHIYSRDKPQQISDSSAIEKMIDEVISANPAQVAQFKGGKRTVSAFFVGQVMKLSKGQANPKLLNELVEKKLDAQ
jgi:aspartyl-tRNA(Asn)/glutamyl-tRNA(Gln) amidotransferase subunit B